MRALVICCLLVPVAASAADESMSPIAVLEFQGSGVEATLLPTLTEILTVEVHQLGIYRVISGRDIQAMLGFEAKKQGFNCDDVACLAEIGGALGVDRILSSHLGKVGDTYVVNIKLINIAEASTEDRVYETITGKQDALIETIRKSVRRLLGAGSKASSRATGAPTHVAATQTNRQPEDATTVSSPASAASSGGLPIFVPIAAVGLGAVSAVVGVIFGLDAKDSESKACEGCLDGQNHASKAESSATMANIFYGVGALALATGGVLFIFTGDSDSDETALVPTVTDDAVVLTLSGSF